jgi:hypothetical protein
MARYDVDSPSHVLLSTKELVLTVEQQRKLACPFPIPTGAPMPSPQDPYASALRQAVDVFGLRYRSHFLLSKQQFLVPGLSIYAKAETPSSGSSWAQEPPIH